MKLSLSLLFAFLALLCAVHYTWADTAAIHDKDALKHRLGNSETDVKTEESLADNKDSQLKEGEEEQNSAVKTEIDEAEKELRRKKFLARRRNRILRRNRNRKLRNRKRLQQQRKNNKNRKNKNNKNRKNRQNRQNQKQLKKNQDNKTPAA